MDLSIVIPAFDRTENLKGVLCRLELNHKKHPEISFETIIINGNTEEHPMTLFIHKFMSETTLNVKHIFCNFGKWINPALPRNIAFKYATGNIFTMIDIDHYVGEDFIIGAINPWGNKNYKEPIVNRGFMIDTCKFYGQHMYSQLLTPPQKQHIQTLNNALIEQASEINIQKVYKIINTKITPPISPWLLSYPSWAFDSIGGYDEEFTGWGSEDDMFYLMLKHVGLKDNNNNCQTFCGVHLYHEMGGSDGNRMATHNLPLLKDKRNNIGFYINKKINMPWGEVPSNIKFWIDTNY